MISTSRQSANRAIMPAVLKGLRHPGSAGASLRRSAWVNLHQPPLSIFRFNDEHSDEAGPSRIVNGLGQHSAGKPSHVQVFHCNQRVFVDNLPRLLVLKVRALIPNMRVRPLQLADRFTAAITSLVLAPRYLALGAAEPGFGLAVVPGVLNLRSIGEDRKTVQTYIDSGFGGTGWKRMSIAFHAKAHEPASGLALDRHGLNCALDGPVQFDLDVPRALDTQLAGIEQAAAVAVGRKGDAVVAPRRAVARKARFLSALHTGVERLVGLSHSAQHVLATGEVGQRQAAVGAHRLQLVRLIVIVDALVARLPGVVAFLFRRVVERAGVTEFAGQEDGLRLRGDQPVFEGNAHKSIYRGSLRQQTDSCIANRSGSSDSLKVFIARHSDAVSTESASGAHHQFADKSFLMFWDLEIGVKSA